MIDVDEIQAFFIKASKENGYGGSGKRITIPGMPGYKALPFKDGDFTLLDCWCVTPHSQRSAGTTTIWYKDDPVWWATYWGWYTEEGIAFLKRALGTAAEAGAWFASRGPLEFRDGGLIYRNHILLMPFTQFRGYEEILDERSGTPIRIGEHEYYGFCLL